MTSVEQQGIQFKQMLQNKLDHTQQVSYRFQGETITPKIVSMIKNNYTEGFDVDLSEYKFTAKSLSDLNNVSIVQDNNEDNHTKRPDIIEPYSNILTSDNVTNYVSNIERELNKITSDKTNDELKTISDNIQLQMNNIKSENDGIISNVNSNYNIGISNETLLGKQMNSYIDTQKQYNKLVSAGQTTKQGIFEEMHKYNVNYAIILITLLGMAILAKKALS
jgi:transcriptional regulator with PAS, ATPase and Fis domain